MVTLRGDIKKLISGIQTIQLFTSSAIMRSRLALVAPFVAFLVLVSLFLRQEQSEGGSGIYDFARRVR